MKSEDVDILWHGKYITVVSPKIAPYEIILEDDGVFVIPIIGEKIGIRKEYCPPYLLKNHDVNELFYTVITGDIDDGETDGEAAVRELKEEAGITILSYKILYYKKNIPLCKSTSLRSSIYIINIDNYRYDKPETDGTDYEKKSKTIWVTPNKLTEIVENSDNIDYLLLSGYFLLKDKLDDKFFWIS